MDCLEGMRQLPDKCIDLVLTDPPYGIGMDKGFEGFGGFGEKIARKKYVGEWDSERPTVEVFNEILRISKATIIFGGNFFADVLPKSTHWLVWDKLNTMPTFSDCELIWTNINRKSVKKYTHLWNGLIGKEDKRDHPSQKPLELIRKLLADYSEDGMLICDPFMGSGTTARACKDLGRNFIGFELEPKYVEIANKRLQQEVML